MTSRAVISTGPATGADVMANLNGHVAELWDRAACVLTSVGGTGNAVTASLDPPLLSGLVAGMLFVVTWGASNTGAVTLAINGGSAVGVVDARGNALPAGALVSGLRSLVSYNGTHHRVLTPLANATGVAAAAVARFDGTTSPPTLIAGSGVAISGVRTSAGVYRFTMASPAPTLNYSVFLTTGGASGGGRRNSPNWNPVSTTVFDVENWDQGANVAEDAPILCIAVYY